MSMNPATDSHVLKCTWLQVLIERFELGVPNVMPPLQIFVWTFDERLQLERSALVWGFSVYE